ncbi:NAD-dependent succinate-semialdehyde dehydrogenase [uncultured Corynebacterium sp.]|uniref:NAD-dependent succinate-semialdehyde dehydrogenase n=1 Tax=uncultured Corynebacterium sp. TaxID=159447 RepID=UPI0025D94F8D|nr:NAD-dependent succinate-semialdehyde dehydrogenase [uncultured Corynebacterium sp.]
MTYAVTDPTTGEIRETFATFTDDQIRDAVTRAEAGYRIWSEVPVTDRAAAVARCAQIQRDRREEFAQIITAEMGKPLDQALGEVDLAADITAFYADNAEAITGDQPLAILGEGSALIRRAPLGVLLGIMPWNFPSYQVARFAAPNLVLGNTIILKHAPQCPRTAALLEEIYAQAGFPPGAYVNVYATNDQAADIIADTRVQGVSVTGSERAGAAVAEQAGRHLKKVALELGGSDPFLVLSTPGTDMNAGPDAGLDAVVEAAVAARTDNNGQVCNAPKRFIVVDDLYDAFLAKFTAGMAAVPLGAPTVDGTVLGPLSSPAAADRLADQVDRAVAQGATLLTGGVRDGNFFPGTVLADVTPEMDAYREEFFGPVGVVYRATDEEDAVRIANDTPFGLGSYVYTDDPAQADRVATAIEAGMVYVNCVLADSPELPFGGVKRSGTSRELGLLAADEFVNKKLIRIGE